MPVTEQQIDRLTTELSHTNSRLAETIAELRQTRTVVTENLSAQRAFNRRVDERLDDHSKRIRSIEQFKTHVETRLPSSLVDGQSIEERFSRASHERQQIRETVNGLSRQVAKIGGAVAAVIIIIEILAKVVF